MIFYYLSFEFILNFVLCHLDLNLAIDGLLHRRNQADIYRHEEVSYGSFGEDK